jgi:threonine dehydrogenase-like Zn-dependent dehydrogenase
LVVDPGERMPSDAIVAATQGCGVDLALECVGANDVLVEALASLGPRGRCALVGVSAEPIELGPLLFFSAMQARLIGVRTYRREHYTAVLRLVTSGRLHLDDSISAVLALEEVNEAIRLLDEKEGDPIRIMLSV